MSNESVLLESLKSSPLSGRGLALARHDQPRQTRRLASVGRGRSQGYVETRARQPRRMPAAGAA